LAEEDGPVGGGRAPAPYAPLVKDHQWMIIKVLETEVRRREAIFGTDGLFTCAAREKVEPIKRSLLQQMLKSGC